MDTFLADSDSTDIEQLQCAGNASHCADDDTHLLSKSLGVLNRSDSQTKQNCSEYGENNPFIMVWWLQSIYYLAFVSMVIIAAGGNIIVVWIVCSHKRMRCVTNFFLVNLAVADALISIMNTLFNFIYMLYSHWPFGRTYCKMSQFVATCTIAASTFTFMAIAIER